MSKKSKNGQVGMEYMLIVGFVTFFVIIILGIALFYSGATKDHIRSNQVANYANKVISTAESVYYSGEPSKATIFAYLPDGVEKIEVNEEEDLLIISFQSSSGLNERSFPSNVPISLSGILTTNSGLKKIQAEAVEDKAILAQL